MKITKDNIRTAIRFIGGVATYVILSDMAREKVKNITKMVRYNSNPKYSDAVDAIMDSRMFSSDKSNAVKVLKQDGDADFYKAVIKVVNSNMYSSDKIKLITELSTEEEES